MHSTSFRNTGRALALILAAVTLTSVGGCKKHYRVTDTNSGTTYYAKGMNRKADGSVVFKNRETGERVAVQNSEVERITRREYRDAVRHDDE